jgi:cell division transport system permease protein
MSKVQQVRAVASSWRVTAPARKALSLQRDGVFRLLVVMTALLGWVVALGAGGTLLLHGLYGEWKLQRESTVMVYLMPDTPPAEVEALRAAVAGLPGVAAAEIVPQADLAALLQPYIGGADSAPAVPLPQVLEVRAGSGFDRQLLDPVVKERFPTAEVDDAQPVLAAVARGVQLAQMLGIGLALLMVGVMSLLVTLTVRAGLRAQRSTLELLQHLGATGSLLTRLVAGQVLQRVLLGWALAGAGAVAVMLAGAFVWPQVQPVLTPAVWIALALAPGLLPLAAWFTARRVVRGLLMRAPGAGA